MTVSTGFACFEAFHSPRGVCNPLNDGRDGA